MSGYKNPQASKPVDEKLCYLFVGNPGTGKSTLINGVLGEPLFKSGDSCDGSGITFQFDQKETEQGVFMDTPGLADEQKKKQAAEAITTALKQDGFYRIFFVLTVEAGRVRPADKATMKLILDAAPTISDYSIIVNKVETKWLAKLKGKPELVNGWITTLMSGLPKLTASVHFMVREEILVGEDDVKYQAPAEIIDFIKHAPGMVIQSKDVNEVHSDEFEKLEAEHAALLEQLETDKAAMQKEMELQKKEMTRAIERVQESARKAQEEADRRQKESDERYARAIEDAKKERKQLEETMNNMRAESQQMLRAAQEDAKRAEQESREARADADRRAQETFKKIEQAQEKADKKDQENQDKINQLQAAEEDNRRKAEEARAEKETNQGGLSTAQRWVLGISTLGISEGVIALGN